ncbi:MAG: hypothetical protein H0V17_23015 [Deltaproteobacteria bacterium]|nr:hypothetical protein [Deltaproteobacteria bacterium]
MRARVLALVLGGTTLLGFGLWLGRSSSSEARVRDTSVAAEPVERARPVVAAARPQVVARPSLPRRAPSPARGLAADLISSDTNIRRAAVAEVAQASDADPQVLLAASKDVEPGIAGTAFVALGKLYADGQVPVADMIARATDRSVHTRVRPLAINALGAVANPDAAAVLATMVATGDVGERRAASALLAMQDAEIAVPALIRALADADEYVRDNALNGLKAKSRGRDFGTDAGAWQAWWQSRR